MPRIIPRIMPQIILTNHTTNHALVLKLFFETSGANHKKNDTSETYPKNQPPSHTSHDTAFKKHRSFRKPPQDRLLFGGPAKLQRKGSARVPQVDDGCHDYSTRNKHLYHYLYLSLSLYIHYYVCIYIYIYTYIIYIYTHDVYTYIFYMIHIYIYTHCT